MIKREIVDDIENWLGEDKILIIKGPRQVGKTTIMNFLKDKLDKEGRKTYYFNMDEELFNPIFQNVKYFIKYIEDQIELKEDSKTYIFLDEFQYIKDAGLFLKVLFDKFKLKIQFIVSGSSSLEITKNTEFLTGRKIEFFVRHLSFWEYITYKSKNKYQKIDLENATYLADFELIYKEDIKMHLLDYINYSGYPEICLKENVAQKKIILKELINTYIKKDIIHFLKIENINAFNHLIQLLCNQVGNLVNKNELANTLNINYDTINRYLDVLEGTYIFYYLKSYFSNLRKEISKMPKVFVNDVGTLNCILDKYYDNLDFIDGNIIENFIFNQLNYSFEKINYYRTISKSEIDFIIIKDNQIIPIEVKYRNKAGNIPLAIKNFEANYENVSKKILITKDELEISENNYKLPFYLLPFVKI